MNDHDAILALMSEYCDSIDRGDLGDCAALFAEGAWGIEGDLAHGADAVKALLDNVTLYDGRPMTRHLMSNVRITVQGDGAQAQSCITVMQGLEDFPLQAIFIGTYFDSFSRGDGGWVWRERRIVPDLIGDLSRHRRDMAPER
ncbi:MAG: nuclear transport factor 2 family protein [Pseudomonadota bacterium]